MKYKVVRSSMLLGSLFLSTGALAFSSSPPEWEAQSPDELESAVGVVAANSTDAVNALAQGCYAIQSAKHGTYIKKTSNGSKYHFEVLPLASASHFYMKPSKAGSYFITDKDGQYFSTKLPYEVSVGSSPGVASEWDVTAVDSGDGEYDFRFKGSLINQNVRHNFNSQNMYFVDLLNPLNIDSENNFRLIAQSDCTAFPEIETNVAGNPDVLKGDANLPVRGFIEPHAHISSNEFMGGKFIHGEPYSRWGVETALRDSKVTHGENGSLDLIGNIYSTGSPVNSYNTKGWPDFPYWPHHDSLSHTGYYYKWIERAHLSGMRIMVTDLVENQVLCTAQTTINPISWIGANSCDTMASIRLQAQRIYELEAYVDAQQGGPGKGFFQVVTSSEQARQVIANGQLAVVLGVEASETFNCGEKDSCDVNTVESALNELYDLGVRSIFPTHKSDNKLGGSYVEHGFINVGQWLATGHFFNTKECDAETKGNYFTSGFPLIGGNTIVDLLLGLINLNPIYDESIQHCNEKGLTELGVYLVNRMIDKNMLIELDHTGADTTTSIMDIVEARDYSGVITSHGWMHEAKDGGLHYNTKRLIQSGGFATPMNSTTDAIAAKISTVLDEIETSPYLAGVGIATDMSGLADQPGPRGDSDVDPLTYPYTSEFGLVFDKQVSGNRVFDLNQDGIAHYGMVADHLQDIREQSSSRIYEAVMNSAEAYLQMWERSEGNTNTDFVNPL